MQSTPGAQLPRPPTLRPLLPHALWAFCPEEKYKEAFLHTCVLHIAPKLLRARAPLA